MKRSLTRIIGESVVSFGDTTVMYEVPNVLNERPIGFKPSEDFNEGTVLRPNGLLLGRSLNEAHCGFWDESGILSKSNAFKTKIVDLFLKKKNSEELFPHFNCAPKVAVDACRNGNYSQ